MYFISDLVCVVIYTNVYGMYPILSFINSCDKRKQSCVCDNHQGKHYATNVFSFDSGKAHCGYKCTPLLLNGLIKTISLAIDDSEESVISLIKMLKALHLPAESHLQLLFWIFLQHFSGALRC